MDLNEEKLFNTVPTDNLIDLNTILDSCVNVNTREKERKTPILMQVIKGDLKMVKLLIDRGADVNAENYKGESALFIPIMFNNLKMVELLIENGADINKTNNEGNTPLFMGIMRYEIVNYLLERGAITTLTNSNGQTPCMLARERRDYELADILEKRMRVMSAIIAIDAYLGCMSPFSDNFDNQLGKDLFEYI